MTLALQVLAALSLVVAVDLVVACATAIWLAVKHAYEFGG